MIGVDMVADRKTKAPLDKKITRALFHEALERGLVTMSYSNVIRINPPLVITEDEALQGVDILDQVLRRDRTEVRAGLSGTPCTEAAYRRPLHLPPSLAGRRWTPLRTPRGREGAARVATSGAIRSKPLIRRLRRHLLPEGEAAPVLRGGFIGFGNVAANGHMPGWRSRDDVRIVAATDAAASRREAFLDACPDGRWFETVDDLLLRERLDFVDVCAPPGSHAEIIGRALDAGLHVLSEKPLVTRVDDAARLKSAAARAGRVLHTVHNWLQRANLPEGLGADRRGRDRRRPLGRVG